MTKKIVNLIVFCLIIIFSIFIFKYKSDIFKLKKQEKNNILDISDEIFIQNKFEKYKINNLLPYNLEINQDTDREIILGDSKLQFFCNNIQNIKSIEVFLFNNDKIIYNKKTENIKNDFQFELTSDIDVNKEYNFKMNVVLNNNELKYYYGRFYKLDTEYKDNLISNLDYALKIHNSYIENKIIDNFQQIIVNKHYIKDESNEVYINSSKNSLYYNHKNIEKVNEPYIYINFMDNNKLDVSFDYKLNIEGKEYKFLEELSIKKRYNSNILLDYRRKSIEDIDFTNLEDGKLKVSSILKSNIYRNDNNIVIYYNDDIYFIDLEKKERWTIFQKNLNYKKQLFTKVIEFTKDKVIFISYGHSLDGRNGVYLYNFDIKNKSLNLEKYYTLDFGEIYIKNNLKAINYINDNLYLVIDNSLLRINDDIISKIDENIQDVFEIGSKIVYTKDDRVYSFDINNEQINSMGINGHILNVNDNNIVLGYNYKKLKFIDSEINNSYYTKTLPTKISVYNVLTNDIIEKDFKNEYVYDIDFTYNSIIILKYNNKLDIKPEFLVKKIDDKNYIIDNGKIFKILDLNDSVIFEEIILEGNKGVIEAQKKSGKNKTNNIKVSNEKYKSKILKNRYLNIDKLINIKIDNLSKNEYIYHEFNIKKIYSYNNYKVNNMYNVNTIINYLDDKFKVKYSVKKQ